MNFRAKNQNCNLRENSNIWRICDTKHKWNYFWRENSNIFKEFSLLWRENSNTNFNVAREASCVYLNFRAQKRRKCLKLVFFCGKIYFFFISFYRKFFKYLTFYYRLGWVEFYRYQKFSENIVQIYFLDKSLKLFKL